MEKTRSYENNWINRTPSSPHNVAEAEKRVEAAENLNPQLFVVENNPDERESGSDRDSASINRDDHEEYPEGGLRAWLVVFGSWLALFSSLGIMNTLGTFLTYVKTHQLSRYDEGTLGWVFSLYTFVCFFMGVYFGPIFDKYGPRWLIFIGTVSITVSLMLLSISTELWHFILSFGLFCGMGSSLLFTPSIASVGHWFRKRRGLATGMASTGGSFGGIVFPLMLQRLFVIVGWGWAIRILGFICLALCIAANFLIRSRLPPAENAKIHPDPRVFKNRAFLWTTIAVFLLELALFIPLSYISSYALQKGFSSAFAFQILPVLNVGSVFGRALPGYWADKIGPFNSNMLMILFSAISCLAVWLPAGGSTAGIVVFALMFGFASGSNISLIPVCIGRLCRTQEYGRYYATCYTIVSIACLIGVPVGGNILNSNNGQYWGLIVFTGTVYIGSFLAFWMAKAAQVGWSIKSVF